MSEKLLEAVERETGANPEYSVIWIHGLGDSGHGFVAVVRQLDLTGCPAVRFVLPHAPNMPVTINGGYVMPSWYDIRGADIAATEDEAGIRASHAMLNKLIEREIARGIPAEKIFVAGFSQGCAMALQIGLRFPQRLAGIIGLSGYVPLGHTVPAERSAANLKTPIFLAHGRHDAVIPILRSEQTRDYLAALGHRIEWRAYQMEHNVIDDEVDDIAAWLRQIIINSPQHPEK